MFSFHILNIFLKTSLWSSWKIWKGRHCNKKKHHNMKCMYQNSDGKQLQTGGWKNKELVEKSSWNTQQFVKGKVNEKKANQLVDESAIYVQDIWDHNQYLRYTKAFCVKLKFKKMIEKLSFFNPWWKWRERSFF